MLLAAAADGTVEDDEVALARQRFLALLRLEPLLVLAMHQLPAGPPQVLGHAEVLQHLLQRQVCRLPDERAEEHDLVLQRPLR